MKYCPYCMNEMTDDSTICPQCGKNTAEYEHPSHTLKQGAMLHDRYMIGGVIGEGGFGITYIGLDTLLQYRVAVKEFFPNGMVNRNNTVSNDVQSISTESARKLFSKSRENFLREARTLAKFNNEPGIVSVKDFFEENHTVYIVMEYLDGITLKSYLSKVGVISPYNTVCLLMPVFRSLQKIHEKKLIHRDISPDNIMLVDENVKLLDFGAAREFADERSLSVMLKHGYAPMEQYRRHGTQGTWTDVYAICATMYKCITGSVPPDAPDRVFEDELKMPSELGIDIEPEFENVLRHGLAIKPDERIQTIDELLDELNSVPGIDIEGDTAGVSGEKESAEPDAVQDDKPVSTKPSAPKDEEDEDVRLSEYVPSFAGKKEEQKTETVPVEETKPEENKREPVTEPQVKDEKEEKKNKKLLPVIIGSAAAAAVIIGVIIAVAASGSGKPVQVDDSGEAAMQSSETTETTETEDTFAEKSDASENTSSSLASEKSSASSQKETSKKESSAKTEKSSAESVVSRQESMRQQTSRQESMRQQSSGQESTRQESSKQASTRQESSRQESSRQESSRQESSKQESSKQESSKQESTRQESSKQESSDIVDEFDYADMGSYVYFDNDVLHVDNSLFGKSRSSIEMLFGDGTMYETVKEPDYYGEAQDATFLSVPIKSSKNVDGNIETIDFFFFSDVLYEVRYATKSSYNKTIQNRVTKEYGEMRFQNGTEPESMDLVWVVDKEHFLSLRTEYYGSDLMFVQKYEYIDYEWE